MQPLTKVTQHGENNFTVSGFTIDVLNLLAEVLDIE